MSIATIVTTAPGHTKVYIDGKKIEGVVGVSFQAGDNQPNILSLKIEVEAAEIDSNQTTILKKTPAL